MANKEVQVLINNKWVRYVVTYAEYVDMYVEEAEAEFEEVRVIERSI